MWEYTNLRTPAMISLLSFVLRSFILQLFLTLYKLTMHCVVVSLQDALSRAAMHCDSPIYGMLIFKIRCDCKMFCMIKKW